MKKINISIIVLILLTINLNAQNQDYKSTITAGVGFSAVSIIFNAISTSYGSFKYESAPALQVSYDYLISDIISAGVAVSNQNMSYEYNYYDATTNTDIFADVTASRTNIALRGLAHYGKQTDFDLYSGLRLGYTIWSFDANVQDYDTGGIGSMFAPQLILFGARGYFTEHIGANAELSIGSPHYLSFGLNARF